MDAYRMQDRLPLVSVIMPSFDSAAYIEASINSVRNQSVEWWELLISDDGSSDATPDLARQFQEMDSRIRLLASGQNRGPAHARNVAIEAASGRYIAFLDSDDLWKPEKLKRQIAFMQKHNVAFSFSSYDRIDEAGDFINLHHVEKAVNYRGLLKTCVIGCLTAVYDTQKLGKMYMPDIRKRQDFGLWLRILKDTDAAYPIPESLAQYRVRTGSVSANKVTASKYTWSIYRDVEKLGILSSAYYFSHYAIHGIFNTYLKPLMAR
jgi:glycosyltransferase involved in cell wall biosynthesis